MRSYRTLRRYAQLGADGKDLAMDEAIGGDLDIERTVRGEGHGAEQAGEEGGAGEGPDLETQLGADGKDWYNDTTPAVVSAAAQLGVEPHYLADILAITSPRVVVSRNIRMALGYIRKRDTQGFLPGVIKALEYYEETGLIRGPKTGAFARALMGDGDAVVLDVWMARALNVDQSKLGTLTIQTAADDLMRRVGKSLGWQPAEVQAAIWTHWVRTHRDKTGRRRYAQAPSFAKMLMAQQD